MRKSQISSTATCSARPSPVTRSPGLVEGENELTAGDGGAQDLGELAPPPLTGAGLGVLDLGHTEDGRDPCQTVAVLAQVVVDERDQPPKLRQWPTGAEGSSADALGELVDLRRKGAVRRGQQLGL